MDVSSLSATELDALIAQFAKARIDKQPLPPTEAPKVTEAILNPAWYTMLVNEGTLFQIRHPGLGWMSFVIPAPERAHLMALLLQQALLSPHPPAASPAPPTVPQPGPGSGGKLH